MSARIPTRFDHPLRVEGAFRHTSWNPEQREAQSRRDYDEHIAAVRAEFDGYKDGNNDDDVDAAVAGYIAHYTKLANAYYVKHASAVSMAITGAGGWTAAMRRRKEKTDSRLHDLLGEWINKSEAHLNRIRARYDPARAERAPVNVTDSTAVARLAEKIAQAKAKQERMKATNKIARSVKLSDAEKLDQIAALHDGSLVLAEELLYHPRFSWYDPGYQAFELSNNLANIKRMEEQKAKAQRYAQQKAVMLEAKTDSPDDNAPAENWNWTRPDGVKAWLRVDYGLDRVVLSFSARIERAEYVKHRSYGLRWSPTHNAFLAYITGGTWRMEEYLRAIGFVNTTPPPPDNGEWIEPLPPHLDFSFIDRDERD